jgi:hypothetical protein
LIELFSSQKICNFVRFEGFFPFLEFCGLRFGLKFAPAGGTLPLARATLPTAAAPSAGGKVHYHPLELGAGR